MRSILVPAIVCALLLAPGAAAEPGERSQQSTQECVPHVKICIDCEPALTTGWVTSGGVGKCVLSIIPAINDLQGQVEDILL